MESPPIGIESILNGRGKSFSMNLKTSAKDLDMEEDELKEINPNIKVLLSSGYSIDGEATKILERGCNGFIQKPFDIKQLSKSIRAILDK
jgi:DNA-binding NarL/FixJ family response regulator